MKMVHEILAVIKTDYQLLKPYLFINFLLWIPVASLVNIAQNGLFFSLCTISTIALIGSIMQLGTSDEISGNFQLLRLTFPVRRSAVQLGHFCSVFLATIIGYLIGIFCAGISWGIMQLQHKPDIPLGFVGEVCISFIVLACCFLVGALMLVCLAKFGFTKGFRYCPFVGVLALLLGIPLFLPDGPLGTSPANLFLSIISTPEYLVLASSLLLCLSCVLYGVSGFLAATLYRKRQL